MPRKKTDKTDKIDNRYPCPCCGSLTIESPGDYEVCPVCGWEDDKTQSKDPDLAGGANVLSLNEARKAYLEKIKPPKSAKASRKAPAKTERKDAPAKTECEETPAKTEREDAPAEAKRVLHDKDIREPLCFFLEETFGKSRIFEEKRMGNSRADMVMVLPEALCGIEIKSDADTYARLSRQVKDYSRYYDYNYVVVGGSHGNHIEEHVPEDWGIITVDNEGGKPDFYILRKAAKNPNLDPLLKISILWRPELNHILELNGLKPCKSKSKAFVQQYILDSVLPEVLSPQLSEELFQRDYETIAQQINEYRASKGLHKHRNTKKRKRRYKAPK